MIRVVMAMTAAAALLIGGCKGDHNQNTAQLRVLHAVVDSEPLNVEVDDEVKHSGVALNATTSYTEVPSGTHDFKIRSSTGGTQLLQRSLAMGNGDHYTLVVFGKRTSMGTLLIGDNTSSPSSGKFKLRAGGFSSDVGAADMYLASGDLSAATVTFTSVNPGTLTEFAEFSPGAYRFIFTVPGTREVVFESPSIDFSEGARVTVASMPTASARLANAVMLTEDSGSQFLPNPRVRMKAVNAIAGSDGYSFKADATTLLSAVPYGGNSSYVITSAGARTLQIESSGVPGVASATLEATLDAGADYTAVALNSTTQPRLVVFKDDNTPPASGYAKIRFVHALAGTTSVDALINFATQAAGLPSQGASSYYPVVAGEGYTLTFAGPGGVAVIASLADVEIISGAVYTAYLVGQTGSAQARLVRDR